MSNRRTTMICAVLRAAAGTGSRTAADEAVQTDKTSIRLTSAEQLGGERSMAAVVIIDNPFATLWYHPEKRIVHHRIHQFISGKAFRDLLLTGTDVLTKHQATKIERPSARPCQALSHSGQASVEVNSSGP